jgi:hypothetical protein
MKLTERLKAIFEKVVEDDIELISSLLSNDEMSSDKELIQFMNDETESKLDQKKLKELIKKERSNFLSFKYKTNKQAKEIIGTYLR